MEQELNVIQKLYNDSIISKSQLTKLMTSILTQVMRFSGLKKVSVTFMMNDMHYDYIFCLNDII